MKRFCSLLLILMALLTVLPANARAMPNNKNDTIETATQITSGSKIYATLGKTTAWINGAYRPVDNEDDYYTFTLEEKTKVLVDFTSSSARASEMLELLMNDQEEWLMIGPGPCYFSITLDPGIYYVHVQYHESGYIVDYTITLDYCTHDSVSYREVQPTCTDRGYTLYTCSDCKMTWEDNYVPVKHSYGSWEPYVVPTCTEAGSDRAVCTLCGNEKYRHLSSLGHKVSQWEVTKAPTCTVAGTEAGPCTVCGETVTRSIKATGHSYGDWVITDPTCTEEGNRKKTCSNCGDVVTEKISATGHTELILIPAVDPTCEQTGLTAKSECSVCRAVLSNRKTVPALGHTAVRKPYKAPTCSKTGLTAGSSCSVCGKELAAQKTIPTLPHTEVESWTIEPTCTEAGQTGGTHCDVCYKSLSDPTILPALGHRKVIIYPATEPTCTGSGATESSYCGVCGVTIQSQYAVKALGHNYVDDVCTRCGKNSTNWTWELSGNTLTISGTGDMTDFYEYVYNSSSWFSPPWAANRTSIKTVIVEEGITGIGNYAFSSCTGLTRVYLPNSLTDIGDYAFSGCTSLSSITLPGNLTGIGSYAFNECTSLSNIVLPDSITGVGTYAFYQCSYLSDVTLPGSLTSISSYMFANCDRLYRIVLPEGVTEIQSDAFYSCDRLNYVGLPDSLTIIGSSVFAHCTNLGSITLPDNLDGIGNSAFAGCTYLSSVTFPDRMSRLGDGLFNGCNVLKSVTLPDGPTSLGSSMFSGCTKLSSVTLPDTLTEIGYGTFDKCPNLTTVDLPDGVTSIGTYAFRYCTLLSSLIMPADLESIGEYVFERCVNLNRIVMTGDAPQIDYNAFSGLSTSIYYPADKKGWSNVISYQYGGEITWMQATDHIQSGICGYGENWKYDMTTSTLTISKADRQYGTHQGWPWRDRGWEIEKLVVEYGVTGITYDLLKNCTSLTSISLPSSLTSISSNAFAGCTGLSEITLPSSLTSISGSAFAGCTGLDRITFRGSAPTSIGTEPFARVNAVVYFSGEDGTWTEDVIAQLGSDLIAMPRYSGPGTCGENLTWEYDSVNRTLTISGTGAMDDFYGVGGAPWYAVHSRVDTVVIGDGVTTIGSHAFHNFTGLTGISLPEHLTEIGDSAFRNCSGLSSIAIPGYVEQIGVTAFADCTGISEITFQAGAPESIGDSAFYEVTATVSYPGQNPSWIEELRQDYGGNLTWNSYTCENHQSVSMEEVLPTCTQTGLTGGAYCFVCETVLSEQTEVPATGHTEVTDPAVKPTCIQTGLTEGKHCSVCETVLVKQEIIPLSGHTEVTDPAVEATCTRTGLTAGKHCSVCNAILVKQETTPIKAHTEVRDPAVEATCTKAGLTEGKRCSVCRTVLVRQESIPARGHFALDADGNQVPANTLKADCTNDIVCTVCKSVVKEALGHCVIVDQTDPETALTITNTSSVPFVLTDGTYYSNNHSAGSSSDLRIKANVNCKLNLYYGVSSEQNYDKLIIQLNNEEKDNISGLVSDRTLTLELTAGDTITVRYSKDYSMDKNEDRGWVSMEITEELVPADTLEADCTNGVICSICSAVVKEPLGHRFVGNVPVLTDPLTVTNAVDYPFTLTEGTYYSTNKDGSSFSDLLISAQYDCTLTLHYGVSSEQSFDKLFIMKNGVTQATISGEVTDQTLTLPLSAGDTVTVRYKKDASVNTGQDCGWVSLVYDPVMVDGIGDVPTDTLEPGCEAIVCHYCETVVYEALGHDWDSGVVQVPPTDESEGEKIHTCQRCGDTKTEAIPVVVHTEVTDRAVAPTCAKKGLTEGKHCAVCFKVLKAQEEIPALEHNFVSGTCSRCGLAGVDTVIAEGSCGTDMNWTLYESGLLLISGSGDMTDYSSYGTKAPWNSHLDRIKNVVLEGDITSVGQYAFYQCKKMETVTLPEGLLVIDGVAFSSCSALTEITIPDTVTTIQSSAFSGCEALKQITFSGRAPVIHNSAFYAVTATARYPENYGWKEEDFQNYNGTLTWESYAKDSGGAAPTDILASGECGTGVRWVLTRDGTLTIYGSGAMADSGYASTPWENYKNWINHVVIRDGVTSIGKNAFYYHNCLKSVSIADSVQSIGNNAFSNCTGLEAVTLSRGLVSIGEWAFENCTALTEITLPSTITSVGDYAFNRCTALEKVVLSEGITQIGANMFASCTALKEVVIPDTVTTIGNSAFFGCTGLTQITIPGSIATIADLAFRNCTGLTEITFAGRTPGIRSGAFTNVTATARYPENHGWQAEDLDNYGGALTWQSYNNGTAAEIPDVLVSGACGYNVRWVLAGDGTLTISGSGDMNSYFDDKPWEAYLGQIRKVVIEEGITEIGYYVFEGCFRMKTVSIADSVQRIRSSAFRGCESLQQVVIPGKVTEIAGSVFYGCKALKNVVIPAGVTKIGDSAFYGCESLEEITIPAGVTEIGYSAFSSCKNLKEIVIPAGVTTIENSTFNYCSALESVTLPQGITSIGSNVFYNCDNLETLQIPSTVTSIGSYAFQNCDGLTTLTLPAGLTRISSQLFEKCTALTEVTIPNAVTSIGDKAFNGCTALRKINVPGSVTTIGKEAFYDCRALEEVTLSEGVASIGDNIFFNCTSLKEITVPGTVTAIPRYAFYSCRGLTKVTLSEGVASIGYGAFEYCSDLKEITLPDSLTAMESYAFYYCSALTDVTIPDKVTTISDYAFYNCRKLEALVIPDSITAIGGSAFYSCDALTKVTIPDSVTTLGSSVFSSCDSLEEITIPGSISSIPSSVVSSCKALAKVTIGDGVTSIASSAFSGCDALPEITIPASIATLGNNAFNSCEGLKQVIFTGNAPAIGSNAFGKVTADVYFPQDDETWTDAVMQNYGGELNWKRGCIGGHTPAVTPAVEPSCSAVGLTEGSHCSACGMILVKQDEIPTLPHSYGRPSFQWTEDGKCSATVTCSGCGGTDSKDCTVTSTAVDPTENRSGKIIYAAAVTFGDRTYTDSKTVTLPATGHVSHTVDNRWYSDDENHWKQCGCGEQVDIEAHTPGDEATQNTARRCTVCDRVLEAPLGLDWIEDSVSNPDSYLWGSGYYAGIMEEYGEAIGQE